ncbi:MAG: recombinase family protein [Polyangiaceae bacterium]
MAFLSTTDPLDTCTPSGKLLLHIASAMAEFERAFLIERVKSGVPAVRHRGASLGRPPLASTMGPFVNFGLRVSPCASSSRPRGSCSRCSRVHPAPRARRVRDRFASRGP